MLSVLGAAGVVAAAAIVAIRKKKEQLDSLDMKTPTTAANAHAHGNSIVMNTPRDQFCVL